MTAGISGGNDNTAQLFEYTIDSGKSIAISRPFQVKDGICEGGGAEKFGTTVWFGRGKDLFSCDLRTGEVKTVSLPALQASNQFTPLSMQCYRCRN